MRTETSLVACASRCKTVTATTILAIDKAHELGRSVAVIVLRNVDFQLDYNYAIKRTEWAKQTGGRKVWEAISHLGLKIKKSARGVPGVLDLAVRTQNIEGSM